MFKKLYLLAAVVSSRRNRRKPALDCFDDEDEEPQGRYSYNPVKNYNKYYCKEEDSGPRFNHPHHPPRGERGKIMRKY